MASIIYKPVHAVDAQPPVIAFILEPHNVVKIYSDGNEVVVDDGFAGRKSIHCDGDDEISFVKADLARQIRMLGGRLNVLPNGDAVTCDVTLVCASADGTDMQFVFRWPNTDRVFHHRYATNIDPNDQLKEVARLYNVTAAPLVLAA